MKQWANVIYLLVLASCFNEDPENGHSKAGQWTIDSTAFFKLKAQKGVRSEKSLKVIGRKMEVIQSELLDILNEREKQRLDIYFLKDRQTLTSYTGFPANGYTDTEKGIIYFVDNDPLHLALRHEVMHALSWRLWGNPRGYWLSEGIAVFASRNCGGNNLHALAHDIDQQGKLVSFETLVDSFDFKSLYPSLQSASMVKYIYDFYGVSALKAFWQKGWENAQNITTLSTAELEQRWKNYIQQEEFKQYLNWDKIKESGCE